MSAEVILMNKNGIAIAADSAVTIGNKTKIYNTADKMFMLSKYAPIGILIYNNSSIMGIQLELIIKEYRRNLGEKKFNTLEEYSMNFVEFCIEFVNRYSGEKMQIDLINDQILYQCDSVFQLISDLVRREIAKNTFKNDNELIQFVNLKLDDILSKIKIKKDTEFMSDEYYDNIILKLDTENIINFVLDSYKLVIDDSRKEILRNKLQEAIRDKSKWNFTGYTGIAVTGYGENEIFPSCIQMELWGIIDNKVVKKYEQQYNITHEQNSNIIPLAQTDVMNEFFLGVNEEIETVYGTVFGQKINTEKDSEQKKKLKDLQSEMLSCREEIVNKRLENIHTSLSFLPRDEMIYMAEGMINLTSFKRRLVLDNYSQTVGGPIDLAFISKGDGFIWIKRKKYFDKEMNYVFTENYFNKKGE